MAKLIPIIGMEIHAELATKSKMFCSCQNGYELMDKPNQNICPVCMGHPGMLPVANQQAIEWTILTGLALKMKIAKETKFDRKNYFYPDLPKGYQISQYDQPLTNDGYLEIGGKKIGVHRIHLEEDTGKLSHIGGGALVDLSRAGTPLMELVTDPVINSAQEAKEFCQEYQKILRYLNVSEADMEKGQMRCEANVSLQEEGKYLIEGNGVKPVGDYKLNPKVELKNINSFRAMERAVEYEIKRQTKAIEEGQPLVQETRGWDDAKQSTFTQRVKETAADYRYFPEPDLPPLIIDDKLVAKLRGQLPELPQAKIIRFIEQYQFDLEEARLLTENKAIANYTENVISELTEWLNSLPNTDGTAEEIWAKEGRKLSKLVANWLINRLFSHLNESKLNIKECKITPENFAEFIAFVHQGKISKLTAQDIMKEMFETGNDPETIIQEKNLGQMDNSDELSSVVDKIIANNPKAIEDIKAGKEASIKFLMGQIMKETKGKANPQIISDLLIQKLK